jgi:hypothetical protein
MSERQKWLMKQPTFWLGLLVTIGTTFIAMAPSWLSTPAIQLIAAFVAICGAYGITAAHLANPPRVSLDDMSAAERQKIFDANPQVKARWDAAHAPPPPPPLPPSEGP